MSTGKRTQRLKHQGRILDEIMAWKREELPGEMRDVPAGDVRAAAAVQVPALDFAAALRPPGAVPGVRLIAEIKRASPSKGLLCHDFDPRQLASVYAENGAAAISVLTDARFFQGDLLHISQAREQLSQMRPPRRVPLLRKDFLYHPYQVAAARAAGADALLLIVAVLGDRELRDLLAETRHYGMQALVEVHDAGEVARALAAGAAIIGINNRDLRTFQVDLQTTAALRPLIPDEVIVVSESGIHSAQDVTRLRDMRVDAILVGESLVKAPPGERAARVRDLARAGMVPAP